MTIHLDSPIVHQITDVMTHVIRHNITLLPGAIVSKLAIDGNIRYKLLWTSTDCTHRIQPLLDIMWTSSTQEGLIPCEANTYEGFDAEKHFNAIMTKWLMRVRQGSSRGTFLSQTVMWALKTIERYHTDANPIQDDELVDPVMVEAVCESLSTLPYLKRIIQSIKNAHPDSQAQWKHLSKILQVSQFDSGIIDEEVIISSLSEPWMADSLWASHLMRLFQLGALSSSSPILVNEYNDYLCIVPTQHIHTDAPAPMYSIYAGQTRDCSLEVTGTVYHSLVKTSHQMTTDRISISTLPLPQITNTTSIPSADPDYATRPLWRRIAMSTQWRVPTTQDIIDWIQIEPVVHDGLHPMMGHDDEIGSIWLDLWSAVPEHAGRLYAVSVVYDNEDIKGRLQAIRSSLHPSFNLSQSLALPDHTETEVF